MDGFGVGVTPKDTISDVKCNVNAIISSWDGNLYVYSLESRELLTTYTHSIPIIKLSENEDNVFSDVLGEVKFLSNNFKDVNSIQTQIIGIHTLEQYNKMYVACGWESKLCLIQDNTLDYIDIGVKTQASSLFKNQLALIEGDTIHILDLRTYNKIYTKKIKEQIRSVKLDGNNLFIGTYGGKLSVLDVNSNEENTVNAHKKVEGNKKIGYPVNLIEKYDKLYTCGSDGTLSTFRVNDKITQKVLYSLDSGILKFKKCNSKLTVCCGYNYEKGEGDTSFNPIYIFDI